MARQAKSANPFYVLLVIVGIAFLVSACAYGVMAYRDVAFSASEMEMPGTGLMAFMDHHGMTLLGVEILLLGLFTVGAIGTDEYWQRRGQSAAAGGEESHSSVRSDEPVDRPEEVSHPSVNTSNAR